MLPACQALPPLKQSDGGLPRMRAAQQARASWPCPRRPCLARAGRARSSAHHASAALRLRLDGVRALVPCPGYRVGLGPSPLERGARLRLAGVRALVLALGPLLLDALQVLHEQPLLLLRAGVHELLRRRRKRWSRRSPVRCHARRQYSAGASTGRDARAPLRTQTTRRSAATSQSVSLPGGRAAAHAGRTPRLT